MRNSLLDTLNVTSDAVFEKDVEVQGDLTVKGDVFNVKFTDSSGNDIDTYLTSLDSDLETKGNLTVDGSSTLKATLNVLEKTTLRDLDVDGAVHLGNLSQNVVSHTIRSGGSVRGDLSNGLKFVPGNAQVTDQYISFYNGLTTPTHIGSFGSVADDLLIRTRESNAALLIKQDGNITIEKSMTVGGDLTVNGDVVTLNTTNLQIEDKLITVAKNATSNTTADSSGISFGGRYDLLYKSDEDGLVVKALSEQGKLKIEGAGLTISKSIENTYQQSAQGLNSGLTLANTVDTDGELQSIGLQFALKTTGNNFCQAQPKP